LKRLRRQFLIIAPAVILDGLFGPGIGYNRPADRGAGDKGRPAFLGADATERNIGILGRIVRAKVACKAFHEFQFVQHHGFNFAAVEMNDEIFLDVYFFDIFKLESADFGNFFLLYFSEYKI